MLAKIKQIKLSIRFTHINATKWKSSSASLPELVWFQNKVSYDPPEDRHCL